MRRCRVLALTGGHRVDLDAFRTMLDDVCAGGERDWTWAHAVQPGAQRWLDGDIPFDAVLCHDIPGLHLKRGEPPRPIDPEPWVRDAVDRFFESGTGLVVLHHALAAWPSWDGWAEAIGGRFFYAPGTLRGRRWPSSGYRMASYTVTPTATDHPVCAGVEPFTVDDERYCCPVLDDRIVPLCTTDADCSPGGFTSTFEQVVVGEDRPLGDDHPPAGNVVAWATSAGRSPIVFVEPGDNGATFALPAYRRLVANALAWVASADARIWAVSRRLD
jgi:uncharacterized protein